MLLKHFQALEQYGNIVTSLLGGMSSASSTEFSERNSHAGKRELGASRALCPSGDCVRACSGWGKPRASSLMMMSVWMQRTEKEMVSVEIKSCSRRWEAVERHSHGQTWFCAS